MIKNHIIYNDYSEWTYDLVKAEGDFIWIDKNQKLIDFTSGWNVTSLGWNHPEITQAIVDQAKKNSYAPMWASDSIQDSLADLLVKTLPDGLNAVGRATGGTEANEEAMKTARSYTSRKKILGFKNTYHGQSLGVMAIGHPPDYADVLDDLFTRMDFPHRFESSLTPEDQLAEFEHKLEQLLAPGDVAAVIAEPGIITGWGSTHVAPAGFLSVVRRVTQKYGSLLILDEVGTGFSRCGKLYGMQIEDVVPDIVTFAKGFSNGAAPIGAMVTTTEIANKTFTQTNLTSTFGWTPLACAAALKSLQIHLRDEVWQKAQKDGDYFHKELNTKLKDDERVADIRGIGMEIGVTFTKPGMMERVVLQARSKGLHLVNCSDNNIQLMPPLTIQRPVLDEGIGILVDIIKAD